MRIYAGKKVNSGTVTAKAFVLTDEDIPVLKREDVDASEQIGRLKKAVSDLIDKLNKSKADMEAKGKGLAVDIMSTHIMLLSDDSEESIVKKTELYISLHKVNAEYALTEACAEISENMKEGESEYLRARSEDVGHLSRMLLKELSGVSYNLISEAPDEPSVHLPAFEDIRALLFQA